MYALRTESGLVVRGVILLLVLCGGLATEVFFFFFFGDFDASCWVRTIILFDIFLKVGFFVLGEIG